MWFHKFFNANIVHSRNYGSTSLERLSYTSAFFIFLRILTLVNRGPTTRRFCPQSRVQPESKNQLAEQRSES